MSTSQVTYTPGVGANIAAHEFTEDSTTKVMERIAPGAGVVASIGTFTSITAVGLVSGLSVSTIGKGRIIISCKAATGNTDISTMRLVYKDGAGVVIGTSGLVQTVFTELSDGGSPDYRYGTVAVFPNDACSTTAELYVVTLPSNGTLLAALAAV